MKILIFGAGYVGLSNAVQLAIKNEVVLVDIDKKKIEELKKKISPIKDSLLQEYLDKEKLYISFESDLDIQKKGYDLIIIALPTNFSSKNNSFDTTQIEDLLQKLSTEKFNGLIVIKSTVGIGFTEKMSRRYERLSIGFVPEFLREGSALADCLNPSRIICGGETSKLKPFAEEVLSCCKNSKTELLFTSTMEAEAIKLLSNSYLALRVAFFNEVDTLAMTKNLDSKKVINGIGLDPRIGSHYNNPSFGYGGYCLPKDTKQLNTDFNNPENELMKAVIKSNNKRIKFIAECISNMGIKKLGVYKISMKKDSDNWRDSSILEVLKILKKKDIDICIYDPLIKKNNFLGFKALNNFDELKKTSELIIANRIDKKISKVKNKVFSRDIFNEN
jgi:UDPglucose 6-dehydrogenase